jgi:hypothetical protein
MMKRKGILVCLLVLVTLRIGAVEYHPISFSSTSAYYRDNRAANGVSQSAMRPTGAMAFRSGAITTTGSLSAISASNFETLNSEGGACYNPARSNATIRRERSEEGDSGGRDEDSEAIGSYGYHSPVGATPCLFLALLAALYVVYKRPRSRASSSK